MSYRAVDLASFPRRDHFYRYLAMANPFVSMTVRLDITDWYKRLKDSGYPFFLSFQYAISQAANQVPQFRQRIKDKGIIEYDFCNPSYNVIRPDETYRFCLVNADQPFEDYLEEGRRKQKEALEAEHLKEEGDALGLLFITCTPWIDYIALDLPFGDRDFSNPCISWGRFEKEKKLALEEGMVKETEQITIPVSVMANHGLIDGIHISKFLTNLKQELEKMTFDK